MDVVGSKSNVALAKRMSLTRKRLMLTQMKLAAKLKVAQATISRLEKDPASRMSPGTEAAIRKWLEVAERLAANSSALKRAAAAKAKRLTAATA